MDQISQIQVFVASYTQRMIEDLRWMQNVSLTPAEAHAIQNLATKGNTGTIGVDTVVQPLNIYELNRAADFQLTTIERAERFFALLAECDAVISMLPSEFPSEQEQLEELQSLKKQFYEAEERLHTAERRAEYYQERLHDAVSRTGQTLFPTAKEVSRNDL